MKKVLNIILCFMLCLSFVGCNSDEPTSYTSSQAKTEVEKEKIEQIQKEQEAEQKAKQEKKEAEEKQELLDKNTPKFFSDIYVNLISKVGETPFYIVEGYIESTGYKYKVEEPTEEDLGTIKVYNSSNNDSITIMSYPNYNGTEIITLVQYDQKETEKCVSVSDDFGTHEPDFSVFDGTNRDAYSLEEQQKFLFGE